MAKQNLPKIRNRFNAHQRIVPTQIERKNQTVQGEVLSIQDMFRRAAAQGHEFTDGLYMDVEDIDQITSMYRQGHDITDLASHAEHLAKMQEQIQQQIADSHKVESKQNQNQKEKTPNSENLKNSENSENSKTQKHQE